MRIGAILPSAVSPISMSTNSSRRIFPQIRRVAMIRVAEAAAEAIEAVDEAVAVAAAEIVGRLAIIRMVPVRWALRRPIIITVRRPIRWAAEGDTRTEEARPGMAGHRHRRSMAMATTRRWTRTSSCLPRSIRPNMAAEGEEVMDTSTRRLMVPGRALHSRWIGPS